jgi:hypothetical protein
MYVHNGKLVDKKPWSFQGFLLAIINLLWLFVATIFSTKKMNDHAEEYKRSKQQPAWGKGSGVGRGSNIHSFGPAAAAGCASGS